MHNQYLGILQVVQQAPRRADHQVHSLDQALCLGAAVGATHDNAVGLGVVLHEVACHTVDLHDHV